MGTTRGFGGTIRSAAGTPPAAAPAVTGMRNGLSLVGGFGELGADPFAAPAPLLHNTVIDLATFFFALQEGGADFLGINATADTFNIGNEAIGSGVTISSSEITGSVATETVMRLSRALMQYLIGDVIGANNGSLLFIDDAAGVIELLPNGQTGIRLDQPAGMFQMGDIPGGFNQMVFTVDDSSQQFIWNTANGVVANLNVLGDFFIGNAISGYGINSNGQFEFMTIGSGADISLDLDNLNSLYRIGDISLAAAGTRLQIDRAGNNLTVADSLGQSLFLDMANFQYQMGDINAVNNGAVINLDDGGSILNIGNTAANLGISINGVAGFTGTVAPVNTITVNNGIVTAVA